MHFNKSNVKYDKHKDAVKYCNLLSGSFWILYSNNDDCCVIENAAIVETNIPFNDEYIHSFILSNFEGGNSIILFENR
jgi:hypothetical protein